MTLTLKNSAKCYLESKDTQNRSGEGAPQDTSGLGLQQCDWVYIKD